MSARRERPARRSPEAPAGRRRAWVLPTLLLLVALAAVAAWAVYRAAPVTTSGRGGSAPPDLLLVTIDTLRADRLGCYGRPGAETPVIDGLASRGVRFDHSVAHQPLTLPSHASILTGLTPLRHGVRDNAGFVLAPAIPTLAGWLTAAGYEAAAFVSAFPVHSRFGLAQGFGTYDDRFPRGADTARPAYVERRGDATAAAAVAWLRGSPGGGRPVFAWVHLFDPHAPYEPPEPFASRFKGREYEGEIAFSDSQLGVLLEGWRAARGREPVVVVTSDHGEGLGEHGEPTHGLFIYDSTIRVPLVLAGPGIPAGRVPGTLARGIDVAPTLLDLAGVAVPESVEGRSLRGAWEGGERGEAAYVESLFGRLGFGWAPLHGWRERDLMFIDAPRPEIYDLRADPGQTKNLAADRPEDLARMRRAVQAAVAKAPQAKPAAVPRETREQLRSLGYIGSGQVGEPSLRDPKDFAALAVRIENAMAIERADPARAASEFRAALMEDADNRVARRHLAMALVAGRQYAAAGRELRALLAAGDESLEVAALLGESYRLSGRYAEALEAFSRAVEKDPSAPEGYGGRGKTLTALGRPEEARVAFGQALRVAPDDPEALEGLADLALARGDVAEARLRLSALAARDPDDPRVALKRGVLLVHTGEIDGAIAAFRAVVERDPGNAEAAVNLGGALAKSGRPAEAVPYFERAIRAGASGTAVWNGLAVARLETGNPSGAAAALRESLRANPDQPNIRELLGRLEPPGRK